MKLSLKNIKRSEFASQETHCYSAVLYVDGKKFAHVSNDGHGGCDHVYPAGNFDDYAERLAAVQQQCKAEVGDVYDPLEFWCATRINEWLLDRELAKQFKSSVLFFTGQELRTIKLPPGKTLSDAATYINSKYPGSTILNTLPLDEARRVFGQAVSAHNVEA